MAKLSWGTPGERFFESGVDRGVLYLDEGIPWNGLISVNEASAGGEGSSYYVDGVKYHNKVAREDFTATIEAYTYPDEFAECDGTHLMLNTFSVGQQKRRSFGLTYRTRIGNDTEGLDHGYKIHLVYNALATPNEKDYSTVDDDPDPIVFSWDLTTTPKVIPGLSPSAHIVIDSRRIETDILALIEDELYGSSTSDATLITPERLVEIYGSVTALLAIEPNTSTGLADLVSSDDPDLSGRLFSGLYVATSGSRLQETSTPGLYTLET